MKKLADHPSFDKRKQHVVLKKFNRQVISVLGVIGLVIGNYALLPIQAVATETATITKQHQVQETLSTIATDASISLPPSPAAPETTESQKSTDQATDQTATTYSKAPDEKQTEDSPLPEKNEQESTQLNRQEQEEAQIAPQNNSEWTFELKNGQAVITDYLGNPKNITIPAEIQGNPVEINLEAVLGPDLKNTTESFIIETSEEADKAVRLTGHFMNFSKVTRAHQFGLPSLAMRTPQK